MKNFWNSLVGGIKSLLTIDSKLSSKRFVVLVGFLILGVCLFISLFVEKTPADSLVYSIAGLVGTGMGVTGVEKFSNIFKAPKTTRRGK